MLISENNAIEGARIARPIAKITAVSNWRPAGQSAKALKSDESMIRALVRRAEDIDADAIVAVGYRVEPLVREGGIALERICVEGIAVRIALAA